MRVNAQLILRHDLAASAAAGWLAMPALLCRSRQLQNLTRNCGFDMAHVGCAEMVITGHHILTGPAGGHRGSAALGRCTRALPWWVRAGRLAVSTNTARPSSRVLQLARLAAEPPCTAFHGARQAERCPVPGTPGRGGRASRGGGEGSSFCLLMSQRSTHALPQHTPHHMAGCVGLALMRCCAGQRWCAPRDCAVHACIWQAPDACIWHAPDACIWHAPT